MQRPPCAVARGQSTGHGSAGGWTSVSPQQAVEANPSAPGTEHARLVAAGCRDHTSRRAATCHQRSTHLGRHRRVCRPENRVVHALGPGGVLAHCAPQPRVEHQRVRLQPGHHLQPKQSSQRTGGAAAAARAVRRRRAGRGLRRLPVGAKGPTRCAAQRGMEPPLVGRPSRAGTARGPQKQRRRACPTLRSATSSGISQSGSAPHSPGAQRLALLNGGKPHSPVSGFRGKPILQASDVGE